MVPFMGQMLRATCDVRRTVARAALAARWGRTGTSHVTRSYDEPVAEAADGEDVARLVRVGLQLAAQAADQLLDVVVGHGAAVLRPDLLRELLLGDEAPVPPVQQREAAVLLGAE